MFNSLLSVFLYFVARSVGVEESYLIVSIFEFAFASLVTTSIYCSGIHRRAAFILLFYIGASGHDCSSLYFAIGVTRLACQRASG